MSDHEYTGDGSQFVAAGGLVFRGIQGESDYPLLMAINRSSHQADNKVMAASLEEIARVFASSERMDPARNALIAFLANEPARAIGYSRLGWYSSREDTRLYFQVSFLAQEYRGRGLWEAMVRRNEHRLREIADGHRTVPHRYLQAWASDNQADWIAALENTGYMVVRRFHNMLHRLADIPDCPMPDGFEIRPVEPGTCAASGRRRRR